MSQLGKWQKLIGFFIFVLLALAVSLFIFPRQDTTQIAVDPASRVPEVSGKIADPFDDDDLQALKQEVAQLQQQVVVALEAGNLTRADLAMQEADTLVHTALDRAPGDAAVLQQDGCLHRNIAAAYQRVAMHNQAERNLSHAEHAFRLIISFDYENANAWKSLGDLYILRNELNRAEQCVRKAIELDPDYQAARDDLAWILEQQAVQ
jgi:tetratricopeptide (TPR) repeat protein